VKNSKGTALLKCAQCGGFFPWLGWKTFFTSTASPGNGGPLLQPKGQTSVLYTVPPPRTSKGPAAPTGQVPAKRPGSKTEAPVDQAAVVSREAESEREEVRK
jgi:hypothetical protein